jgi:hypothetical protein
MFLFNKIFITGYRAYLQRNDDPRFVAVGLVCMCGISQFFLIILMLNKYSSLNIQPILDFVTGYSLLVVLITIVIIFLFSKYYSIKRIEILNDRFEKLPKLVRQFWGFMTVIVFIRPWFGIINLINHLN